MIKDLQFEEVSIVSGGRFLPGLTRRLNNFIGKPLEKVGREVKRVLNQVGDVVEEAGIGSAKVEAKINDEGIEINVEVGSKD